MTALFNPALAPGVLARAEAVRASTTPDEENPMTKSTKEPLDLSTPDGFDERWAARVGCRTLSRTTAIRVWNEWLVVREKSRNEMSAIGKVAKHLSKVLGRRIEPLTVRQYLLNLGLVEKRQGRPGTKRRPAAVAPVRRGAARVTGDIARHALALPLTSLAKVVDLARTVSEAKLSREERAFLAELIVGAR